MEGRSSASIAWPKNLTRPRIILSKCNVRYWRAKAGGHCLWDCVCVGVWEDVCLYVLHINGVICIWICGQHGVELPLAHILSWPRIWSWPSPAHITAHTVCCSLFLVIVAVACAYCACNFHTLINLFQRRAVIGKAIAGARRENQWLKNFSVFNKLIAKRGTEAFYRNYLKRTKK